jgi:dTDP-glucose 4,6-dehydratase
VYSGHKRTSTYITDMARTLANIAGNFKAGEVYNIGGEDFHSVEDAADLILKRLGKESRRKELVVYKPEELLTTKQKLVDCAKARRDLGHKATVGLDAGIANTLDWMREAYRLK